MNPDYLADLRLVEALANLADEVSLSRFGASDLQVQSKPDSTPVTDADQAVEQLIRRQLAKTRPDDAIQGEEYGLTGQAQRTWVIDPIDGTKNYVRGVPVWATLIGLIENKQAVLGMVSAPALGRRWFAAQGQGAWAGRSITSARSIRVSAVADLADASFSGSSPDGWEEQGRLESYLALTRAVWRTRGYGDFWSYMMVAEGSVDLAAEPELALHDMVAVAAIVEQAGGTFTDTTGAITGPFGSDALASNGLLHGQAVDCLNPGDGAQSLGLIL